MQEMSDFPPITTLSPISNKYASLRNQVLRTAFFPIFAPIILKKMMLKKLMGM